MPFHDNLFELPESFGSVKQQVMPRCCARKFSSAGQVPEAQYEVLMSSHMLEHLANPLRLLRELSTKLRVGGLILSIVPNRAAFWDRARNLTTMEHLIADEEHGTDEGDLTHLEESASWPCAPMARWQAMGGGGHSKKT